MRICFFAELKESLATCGWMEAFALVPIMLKLLAGSWLFAQERPYHALPALSIKQVDATARQRFAGSLRHVGRILIDHY